MHIGMLVGIGPAATDYYYRMIISEMSKRGKTLELTMAHADAPTLLKNQAANNIAAQVAIFSTLTQRLQAAGCQKVAVTSIAGHFCIDDFSKVSPLPIVDMISEIKKHVRDKGYKKLGLIGTKVVMQTLFYGALRDVDVVAPQGELLDRVHNAYVSMASSGTVTEEERAVFFEAGAALAMRQGAQAILLGGTDLVLAFKNQKPGFDFVDCAEVHAKAIVEAACT